MFGFKQKKQDSAVRDTNPEPTPTLKQGLKRTRTGLFSGLFSCGKKLELNVVTLEDMQDRLLLADVGVKTTDQVIRSLTEFKTTETSVSAESVIKQVLLENLLPVQQPLSIDCDNRPFMILVVGVNGVGKTTTIGKMAKRFQSEDKRVMLAAGDTFRAAAVEQLKIWGDRNEIKVIAQGQGANPGAVIYDALASARANNIDVMIVDTAGRLHNKDNLMEEMKKIYRIVDKFDPNLSKEVLLVLDASTGQNAVNQARQFHEAIGISGIALTKLDGTAKGGIIFSLANELGIPVRFIGMGEQAKDLSEFNASDFINALLDSEE